MTSSPSTRATHTPGFDRVVRRDDGAFAALGAEWDALHRRCPAAGVFQSVEWLESWWRSYGRPGALRLVVVRRDGRAVAGAALTRTVRAGVPVLVPVGAGISDWSDVLVDPAVPGAAAALRAALLAEPGWSVLDLPEVAAGGHARELAGGWPGRCLSTPASVCSSLPAAPIEDLVGSLSSSMRADVRRALRRVDAAGVTERRVPVDELPAAVGRLLELHRRQWRARGGMTPEHGRPRFAGHLTRAVTAMADGGRAALHEYRAGGELVASSLLLIDAEQVGGYLYGADPGLYGRVNVTTMLTRTALREAVDRGVARFGLLRGREEYKSGWRAEPARNDRLLLVRPGDPRGLGYAVVVRAAARGRDVVRERLPAVRAAVAAARRTARNPRLLLRSRSAAR